MNSSVVRKTFLFSLVAFCRAAFAEEEPEDIRVREQKPAPGLETRPTSVVRRSDIDERLPRSAPDALRYEPGVFVQQTSHGQGSPFIRGLFGSRVLLQYDGVRLNNATFRQGPNQYFFTLDAQTIDTITVVRGGASTLFGTDALGGALLVTPVMPAFSEDERTVLHARARLQHHQADGMLGARVTSTLETQRFSVQVGAGYSRAGQLRAGGIVNNLSDDRPAELPRFERNGVTQVGTGYKIFAADGVLRYKLRERLAVVAAVNVFRQFDTPRTDQCPPPFGVLGDCATIDEQFRTLAYFGIDGDLGAAAKKARVRVSLQRQHELRTRARPLSFVRNGGIDNVTTMGVSGAFETARVVLDGRDRQVWADLFWGADAYLDHVGSEAWVQFTDTDRLVPYARGQYLDGSSYSNVGAYVRAELNARSWLTAVLGARAAYVSANLSEDLEAGTASVRRSFPGTGAEVRVLVRPVKGLEFSYGVDQSFRAPNLSDLSQRQQTGPGFQLDNASIEAERQFTMEAGAALRSERLRFDAWIFRSVITGYLNLVPRSIDACPKGRSGDSCASSWSRYELVNAAEQSVTHGLEASVKWRPIEALRLQASFTATRGEGPNPGGAVAFKTARVTSARVPLTRIPPVNGSFEARLSLPREVYAGLGLRWALPQTRLSVNDLTDYRIPTGGTPGFITVDLRAGVRFKRSFVFTAQIENLLNAAYRTHGSAVNGAGVGFGCGLEAGF
jgi:outer membrane receptor protein involved in Fe transport